MRKQIVAGNWKMNQSFDEAEVLIGDIVDNLNELGKPDDVEVVICPPFLFLELLTDMINDQPVMAGAQNVSAHEKGAYTGEVSAIMLSSMNVSYTIVGHSERRKYFSETDREIADKVRMALEHDLVPIFCCGELLEDRESGNHFEVVKTQLENGLFGLSANDFGKLVIAYEPVWAIGTGKTATPEQTQEMHAFIRGSIAEKYNPEIAGETTILYGGSCNASNAEELFANKDVDGGLIGGASLKSEEFCKIIRSFN